MSKFQHMIMKVPIQVGGQGAGCVSWMDIVMAVSPMLSDLDYYIVVVDLGYTYCFVSSPSKHEP